MDSYIFYFTQKESERLGKATIWAENYLRAEVYFRLIYGNTAIVYDVDFGSWTLE